MKTTLADKFAVASIVVAALIAGSGVVYGVAAERRASHLIRTHFAQPTPEFPAAITAGERANDADAPLAQRP